MTLFHWFDEKQKKWERKNYHRLNIRCSAYSGWNRLGIYEINFGGMHTYSNSVMNFFVDENDVLINTNDSFSFVFIFISKCHRFVPYSLKLKEVRSLQKFVGNIHSGFFYWISSWGLHNEKNKHEKQIISTNEKIFFFTWCDWHFSRKFKLNFFIPQDLQ